MSSDNFKDCDDHLQRSYEEVKVDFSPACCLSITVLRCRDVSVSYLRDKLDTPDPQFVITCSKLGGINTFKTTAKSDSPTCEIDETFRFVLPKNLDPDEPFPVKVELYDVDILFDDFLGAKTIDVSTMEIGESKHHTLAFETHGEVDIAITKEIRCFPDLRLSVALHEEERAFRKKRFTVVLDELKRILPKQDAPQSVSETPVISLVCSGGGYRATVGMCGAMEAIKDAGLMDVFMYAVGLSGSSWYLTSAYAREGMEPSKQAEFHAHLRESLQTNALQGLVDPVHLANYSNYINQKTRFGQPSSFVDFFGYSVGKYLLGEERMDKCLSDLQPYVKEAGVPFPLFASLNVRNTVAASKYHAYLDISPFEIGFPKFGMGVEPAAYGSAFCRGILSRKCPEMPLHFIQGMCGCAFSILLKQLMETGGEKSTALLDHIDKVRTNRTPNQRQHRHDIEFDSDASGDTDDDDEPLDADLDANTVNQEPFIDKGVEERILEPRNQSSSFYQRCYNFLLRCFDSGWYFVFGRSNCTKNETKATEQDTAEEDTTILRSLKEWSFFKNRDAIIGRTAKVFNVAHGFEDLNVFCMNPFARPDLKNGEGAPDNLKIEGDRKISTRKPVISIADAGVLKNVPTDLALRPQRNTDMLVVLDFNGYASDTSFDYMPLLAAAAHSRAQGLNFPDIDFKQVTEMPPTDFFMIEGDEQHPTVLWFTLSNKKFKDVKNYQPRFSSEQSNEKPFNDFPVFDPGNRFSTFKFYYTPQDFDRLRELMYFNVSSHIDELKEAIAKTVEIKRRRLK